MLWMVLVAGSIQAAAFGLYETSLPLYMDHLGISALGMGVAFALPHLGVVLVRYLAGSRSDTHGRKPFFVSASVLAGITAMLIPVWPHPAVITVIKTVRDSAGVVREVMRSIVLYELAGSRFVRWIGRAIGSEFSFMALGAIAAGVVITAMGYGWVFLISGGLSLASAAVVRRWLREKRTAPRAPAGGESWRKVFSVNLPPNLWVLTAATFVFNIGMMTSHSFYLLLFFRDKFGFSIAALTVIQMLHRLSLGIPLMFTGQLMDRPAFSRHYKSLYVAALAIQGASIAAAGMIPHALVACGVFLIHDMVGASIWSPIQSSFIQRFARPARRGQDVSLATGLSSLGFVFGPLLAGILIDRFQWIEGPYIMSGAITALAAVLIIPLRTGAARSPGEGGTA